MDKCINKECYYWEKETYTQCRGIMAAVMHMCKDYQKQDALICSLCDGIGKIFKPDESNDISMQPDDLMGVVEDVFIKWENENYIDGPRLKKLLKDIIKRLDK